MEEKTNASASDALELDPSPTLIPGDLSPMRLPHSPRVAPAAPLRFTCRPRSRAFLLALHRRHFCLRRGRSARLWPRAGAQSGKLLYGSDMEGGGPMRIPIPSRSAE